MGLGLAVRFSGQIRKSKSEGISQVVSVLPCLLPADGECPLQSKETRGDQ